MKKRQRTAAAAPAAVSPMAPLLLILSTLCSCASPSQSFQFRAISTFSVGPKATSTHHHGRHRQHYDVTTPTIVSTCLRMEISDTGTVATTRSDVAKQKRRDELAKKRRAITEKEDVERDQQDLFFLALAVLPSLLAFLSWEDISLGVAELTDRYGSVGRAADGGQFSNNLLRPTITGVVVPVISIALATLVSTTVNVLRERQVNLRVLVNKESCELRLLRRAIFGMFGTRQHAGRRARALSLLAGYVEQVERESKVGAIECLEELQLSGGIANNELDRISAMLHGVDGAAASRQGSVGQADDIIMSLNGHRSNRVALLLTDFPAIHWGTLAALSSAIVVAFLLVSNQQLLQYLNSLQLSALFAILIGVFSGTATLVYDLADPFRGSFSIAEASTQLEDICSCLKEDVKEACEEAGDISSATRTFIDALLRGPTDNRGDFLQDGYLERKRRLDDELERKEAAEEEEQIEANGNGTGPSSRYGLLSTIYFHLLTGPLGNNVRALGDVLAWTTEFVGTRTRSLIQRAKQWWRRNGESNDGISAS